MSPCLQAVVDGILLALPELEAALRSLQLGKVGRQPFQLALGEDLIDLTGRGFFYLLQGRVDPIPVFRFDAHGAPTLARNWQHGLLAPTGPIDSNGCEYQLREEYLMASWLALSLTH